MCHVAEEPIYITKNGYGDMVIKSIKVYENTMKRLNMYNELALAETQIETGDTKDARQSLENLRDKYVL